MNKVKKKRYALGMSQAEVAKMIGVSRQTYAYIENGKIDSCSMRTLNSLCKFLGLSAFDVINVDYVLRVKPKNKDEAKAIIRMIEEKYIYDHDEKTNR